nr:hypothetical protein [Tanacetum cinerariifolium]
MTSKLPSRVGSRSILKRWSYKAKMGNSCTLNPKSAVFLPMTSSLALRTLWRALPIVVKVATVSLWQIPNITPVLSWSCSIGPHSFLPPVLLLVIVVVSVTVVVVVVVVIGVIVVGVSLVVFPLPFIAFTNSGSPTL